MSNKKEKLKNILIPLLTEEERFELTKEDKTKRANEKNWSEIKNAIQKLVAETDEKIKRVDGKIKPADYSELLEVVREMSGKIGMIKLQERIDRDYSPAYKLMIEKLSSMDERIGGWRYPQYAYTGLRNKSFSPINPATDGIGIGSYDYMSLAQTATADTYTFYQNGSGGSLVATLVINYTDATKATISNVVKTPVT